MARTTERIDHVPPPGTRLCDVSDLDDPAARGFLFGSGTQQTDVFVVRRGDAVYGYVNSCPHIGTPLETLTDRFLSREGDAIVCSTHGARFRIEDGYCIFGPCAGRTLTPLALVIVDGEIRIASPDG